MTQFTDSLIEQAKAEIITGNRQAARAQLLKVTEIDEMHETAWYLLSTVVEDLQEQLTCLENVLSINSQNVKARDRLETLTPISSQLSKLRFPFYMPNNQTHNHAFGSLTFDQESGAPDSPIRFHSEDKIELAFHEEMSQGNLLSRVAIKLMRQGRFVDAQNLILEIAPAYRDEALLKLMQTIAIDTWSDSSGFDARLNLSQLAQESSTKLVLFARILLWMYKVVPVFDPQDSRIRAVLSEIIDLSRTMSYGQFVRPEMFNESDFKSFFTLALTIERLDVAEALLNLKELPLKSHEYHMLELIEYQLKRENDANPYVELLLHRVETMSAPLSKHPPPSPGDFDDWVESLNISPQPPPLASRPLPGLAPKRPDPSPEDFDAWVESLNVSPQPTPLALRPLPGSAPKRPDMTLPRPAFPSATKLPPKTLRDRLPRHPNIASATEKFWQNYPDLLERFLAEVAVLMAREDDSNQPAAFLSVDVITRLSENLTYKSDVSERPKATYLNLYMVYANALDFLLQNGKSVQSIVLDMIELTRYINYKDRAIALARLGEIAVKYNEQQAIALLKHAFLACSGDDTLFLEITTVMINSGILQGFSLLEAWLKYKEKVQPFFEVPKLEIDFSRFLPARKFLELVNLLEDSKSQELREWVIQNIQSALTESPKSTSLLPRLYTSGDSDFNDDDFFG